MKNYRIIYKFMLCCVILAVFNTVSEAAPDKRDKKSVIELSSCVLNEKGEPMESVTVLSGEGSVTQYTDKYGKFKIKAKEGSVILVECEGYSDYVLDLKVMKVPETIILKKEPFLAGEKYQVERPDGGKTSVHDLTAAISFVDVENVKRYSDLSLSNTLQGQAAGLIVSPKEGGLGFSSSDIYIRGLHGNKMNAITVVDGIERPVDDILPEEIGSIQVLKDAPAKVLYGPRAANGVLLITTKRGEANKRIINASMEYGMRTVTRMPEYLGAYDYTTLYNEARNNDGMPDYYSQEQLTGYLNSKGKTDTFYPDVNWQKEFVRNMASYRKAVLEFFGGNKAIKYALVAGYSGGSGLEKVGQRSDLNKLNVRGNLDISITDFLTVSADVAARIEIKKWGALDSGEMFKTISSNRPNEYPVMYDPELLSLLVSEDGIPYYGGSVRKKANMFADMENGGFTNERYVNSQTNFGVNLDLNKYVKGLTASAYMTFDNYHIQREKLTKNMPTYAFETWKDETGEDVWRLVQLRKINQSDEIKISSQQVTRRIGWRVNAGYANTFGKNDVSVMLSYRSYFDERLGPVQDCVTSNFSARLNYSYDSKYIAEMTFGGMGSNQFAKNNRYVFTPVGSIAWVISNESFLKGSTVVNFLKFKASFGRLGFYPDTNFLLYQTLWGVDGTYPTGESNGNGEYIVTINQVGNPLIDWTTSTEANIGMEGIFLNNRLAAEVNVFRDVRNGGIGKWDNLYSSLIGSYLPSDNVTKSVNRGLDVCLSWQDSVLDGDFTYSVDFNFTYTKNKILETSELPGIEDYRSKIGKPTSALYGLVSEGLFGKDVPLDGHVPQVFGDYGIGDIAYKDMNNDGVIDGSDETMIGQSFPLAVYGLNVDLQYEGFGLYLSATAQTGGSVILNNKYYWNTGEDGYSVLAKDSYHPVRNPEGKFPRLTTTAGSNSYRSSTYWLESSDFLRLKDLEVSYTINNYTGKGIVKKCKFFVRGNNLFVLSKIKDLDPELLNAGVTNEPVFRTITGGVKVSF